MNNTMKDITKGKDNSIDFWANESGKRVEFVALSNGDVQINFNNSDGKTYESLTLASYRYDSAVKIIGEFRTLIRERREIVGGVRFVGVGGTYTYIKDYIKNNGISPTIREIMNHSDVKSLRGVSIRLSKLQKMGLIQRVGYNTTRNIVLKETNE